MKSISKSIQILLLILFVALILRVVFINSSPLSLYGDELTITLDANSLIRTGYDQLGNILPLTFPMGAGRPGGYVYFSMPFMLLFGPTALGVRALSILSGLGIITLLYFICRKLFSEKAAVMVAIMAAIDPWEISLSRGGFEAHFALFLLLLGLYFLLKAKEKPIFYLWSAISLGLTVHTYPTYKVTLPLFLLLAVWFIGFKQMIGESRKYFISGLVILCLIGLVAFSQTFIGGSEVRFFSINVFSQTDIKAMIEQKLNLERSITVLPESLAKFFHNKPVEYFKILSENYLHNFSFDFLFIHGDRNPRHNMTTMGEFYAAEMVLILIGLLSLAGNKKTLFFLISWILIGPLASAVIGDPHALRSALEFAPLTILSGLGLLALYNQKSKLPLMLVSFALIIQMIFFLQKLYFLAPREYANFWAYSAKLATNIVLENRSQYDYIFVSDQIDSVEFGYPVYAKVNPADVIDRNKNKYQLNGLSFKKFDNVYVGFIPKTDTEKFLNTIKGKVLFIGDAEMSKYLKDYQIIKGEDKFTTLIVSKHL